MIQTMILIGLLITTQHSVNTGPSIAFEGIQYLYTEASNNNHPSETASIVFMSKSFNITIQFLAFIYINMDWSRTLFN